MSLPTEPMDDRTENPLRFVVANIVNPGRYNPQAIANLTATLGSNRRAYLNFDDAVALTQKYYVDEMLFRLNPSDPQYAELQSKQPGLNARAADISNRLSTGGGSYGGGGPRPELFYSSYFAHRY